MVVVSIHAMEQENAPTGHSEATNGLNACRLYTIPERSILARNSVKPISMITVPGKIEFAACDYSTDQCEKFSFKNSATSDIGYDCEVAFNGQQVTRDCKMVPIGFSWPLALYFDETSKEFTSVKYKDNNIFGSCPE